MKVSAEDFDLVPVQGVVLCHVIKVERLPEEIVHERPDSSAWPIDRSIRYGLVPSICGRSLLQLLCSLYGVSHGPRHGDLPGVDELLHDSEALEAILALICDADLNEQVGDEANQTDDEACKGPGLLPRGHLLQWSVEEGGGDLDEEIRDGGAHHDQGAELDLLAYGDARAEEQVIDSPLLVELGLFSVQGDLFVVEVNPASKEAEGEGDGQ
mmetsp:Transcript_1765/g.3890  ORF Transcript_1765/g.3890 Transcript_1765/m.3890 type:complete len:212 (-) Transcript_1765:445-1080(-)